MILEQNYRKVTEYTQKAFKLYSRRYFANLILQILQKKQNIREFQKIPSQVNRNSNFSQNQAELQLQNVDNEKDFERENLFSRTIKNIDMFDTIDKQNMFTDISYLKYGDVIFLQVYNAGMNPSDKSQRLRVYTELQTLKYRRLSHLTNQCLTQKRCAFQIINPYDKKNISVLTGNSLFCLKSLFCNKFICLQNQMKISQFFGYEIGMSPQVTPQCFLSFKGVQSKQKKIISYDPIGIKISSFQLRAQGLEISCNIEGSVFYFNKVSGNIQNLEPEFVKIKNVSLQKYLSSNEIQISKLMSKKTYSNVTIEDQNGVPIKENQLVFATLDFNKISEGQITFKNQESQSMKHYWLLNPVQKNGTFTKQQIKITHVCSGRSLVVKTDKTLKLSNNESQVSYFNLSKHHQSSNSERADFNIRKLKQQNQEKRRKQGTNQDRIHQQDNQSQISSSVHELLYQQSNVMVMKCREQIDRNFLGIYEVHSLGHYKVQENKKIQFEIHSINHKQSQLILELMQIQIILKQSYEFLEKVGFILDQRNQSLRFCVEEIKKYNYLIIYHTKLIKQIIQKINVLVENHGQSQIPPKMIQNIIKQLKIFEILICISKILNLKIGKKKHFAEAQEIKDVQRLTLGTSDSKQKASQTPFQLCQKYFETLQISIFQTIYKLTIGNQQCSNTIVRQASFFNKLLMFYSQDIGKILKQAIKNLSLFTSKTSNDDCNQLFQWVKLIETLKEQNIMVQKTYIDIIAEVVIDPLDRGIVPYQNKCRQVLFNQRNKKKIMPRFGFDEGKPTVTFQTSNITQFFNSNPNLLEIQHYSTSEPCFCIEDFFTMNFQEVQRNKKSEEYIQYMVSLIRLARNLCKDRNKKLLKVAEDYGLSQNHLTYCLNSSKIEWKLKMQYLLLYSAIFVDQDPFLSFQRRENQCHIWSKIDEYNLENKTSLIFKQYTDLTLTIQKLKQFDVNIIPYLQNYMNYCRKMNSTFFNEIKNNSFDKFFLQIEDQLKLFQGMIKFIYEAINFGYFNIFYIKKFVSFIMNHYQTLCNIFQFAMISSFSNQDHIHKIKSTFSKKQNQILNEILKILELNENIWIDINAINLLKSFQKGYRERRRPMTSIELRDHCWKLLNNQIPILAAEDSSTLAKPNYSTKKKTTSKNVYIDEPLHHNLSDRTNAEFDQHVGKFLIRLIISHNQLSQTNSYNRLVEMISKREKRNIELYEKLSSFLIINGKKEENLYRDYSGRVTGKILNVIKIYELINRIKGSENQSTDDVEDEKRKKQKIVELNNLINKIKREISQIKEDDMSLFRKFQLILEKLNIDMILMQLLAFAHKPMYLECISNLYKFYLEFIWENEDNKRKLSKHFQLFMSNFKVQKCSVLIAELYLSLSENQKRKYIQDLFDKLHSHSTPEDNLIKQTVLETLYRIIKKTKQKQLLSQIKSQFTFEIFKQNDYTSLLTIGTNLSTQYINVLCELASKCNFVYDKIRQIYPKTMLRKIIYQQHKYSERSVVLKLFYYFYIKNNHTLEIHQIQDIISNLVLPQIKHLPSVCQYSVLQNLQIKQNNAQKTQKQPNKLSLFEQEEEIDLLKKKFQDLILYEQTFIEPSEQEKYWNFIYNTEDDHEMSLINFTILLLKMQSLQNPQKGTISKKLSKSPKYIQFIKYLNELCQFLKDAFKKNKDRYQRKIINKLEQILIIHEERSESRQKTIYSVVSQEDKQFLRTFFEEMSKIIISENIPYSRIIECAGVTNSELSKRRAGQNVELMILEEEFINFIQKISKYITNVKEFNRMITEKKLTNFFNIYKCTKVRKINIYKFLQKLFEYLESLKNKSISCVNPVFQNDEQSNKTIQNKVKNDLYSFIDTSNQNNTIETHFKSYVASYNPKLKLILLSPWIHRNEYYLKLVFEDLEKQSQSFPFNPDTALQFIQLIPRRMQHLENFDRKQSQKQMQSKFLVYLYLHKMCFGSMRPNHNHHVTVEDTKIFQHNVIEIDSKYYKSSFTFSRVVLFILRKINSYGYIPVHTTSSIFRKYIRQKLEFYTTQSSKTLKEITMQLLINFNNNENIDRTNKIFPKKANQFSQLHLSTGSNILAKRSNLQDQLYESKLLATIICEQVLRRLDNEISQILNFNFNYSIQSYQQGNNFFENLTPQNFKLKLDILQYGLTNNLIQQKDCGLIQNCFVKIITIWANENYSFDDFNWYLILKSIIELQDRHMDNIELVASVLAKNKEYVKRFTQLVENCCISELKSTNVKSMTQLCLLHLLNSFHMKFYLENQQQPLAMILNEVDFELLAVSAEKSYNESIEPKLMQFENQVWCQQNLQSSSKICSLEICNQNKITQNDQNIMEVFVSFLIIIQLSISLNKKKYFVKPLKPNSQQILNDFQLLLKQPHSSGTYSKQISYVSFYKRFIGIVYLSSEEGSLVTLHFKIPYLEKYCDKSVKKEVLYYFRKLKQANVQQHLDLFSKYFQAELEQRKLQSKFPFIPSILQHKSILQKIIILVVFIHLVLIVFPAIPINETIFYPFTSVFICLKIIFSITQYRKSLNIINYLYQDKQLSFKQKISIYINERVFISIALVVFYIISFKIPMLFGLITVLQSLNLRYAHKLSNLLNRALFYSIFDIIIFLALISIFFGIMEWEIQKDQQFLEEIFSSFKEFYTFIASNFKITPENQYSVSKKFPISFFLYILLISIFIFKYLRFFISELKKDSEITDNLEKKCFICDKKSNEFQSQGGTFQNHIDFEHNLWHYLYFFIYLRRKSSKETKNLKNIQISIKQSIEKKKYGFLNIGKLQ